MSEAGRSPFDLEEDATPVADTDPLAEAAAPPPPKRARTPRGTRTRSRRAAAEPGQPGGWKAVLAGFFTSPRWLYGVSALLSALLLFALYNPSFGLQGKVWFWEALQGQGAFYAYAWNPSLLQAAVLPLITLAFAAAAFSGDARGRGLWAAFWVLIAFVTFQIGRDELRYYLPPIVAMAGAGLLIRRARGEGATQAIWIVLLVLGSFLWLPLPESQASAGATDFGTRAYRCSAIGLVDLLIDTPGSDDDGAIVRRAKVLLLEVPQYVSLVIFVLLLLAALGLRGRWMGTASGALMWIFLFAFTWLQFDLGSAEMDVETVGGPDWWNGARQVADAWRSRFLVFLPALMAVMAECGLRKGPK